MASRFVARVGGDPGYTGDACGHWVDADDDLLYINLAGVKRQINAFAQEGTGYSLNLISVTSTTASGNTRGLRVNTTTSASITHGDLQSIHGYLTMGSSVTLGTGAAVYPLSAWLDVPSDITTGSGNIIAGLRVVFEGNGVDLTSLAGGGESALIYAQTWAEASTAIDHGLAIVAGAGSTIQSAIHLGGSGTFNQVLDATEWGADTEMVLLKGGPKDANEDSQFIIAIGDATDDATIASAVGAASDGSIYISTAGTLWQNVSGTWTQIS